MPQAPTLASRPEQPPRVFLFFGMVPFVALPWLVRAFVRARRAGPAGADRALRLGGLLFLDVLYAIAAAALLLLPPVAPAVGGQLGILPGAPRAEGIPVAQVGRGSPAQAAGVRPGDVLESLDGAPLRELGDLRTRLAWGPPGERVLGVARPDGTHAQLQFTPRPPEGGGLRERAAQVLTTLAPLFALALLAWLAHRRGAGARPAEQAAAALGAAVCGALGLTLLLDRALPAERAPSIPLLAQFAQAGILALVGAVAWSRRQQEPSLVKWPRTADTRSPDEPLHDASASASPPPARALAPAEPRPSEAAEPWAGLGAGLACAFALGMRGNAISTALERLLPSGAADPRVLIAGAPRAQLPLLVLSVAVLAPIGEELVFRGLVHGWARRFLPPLGAVLASGAVFGAAHLNYGPRVLAPFLLGLLFADVYDRSGDLRAPMLLHAAINGFSTLLLLTS